jgi:hypothetical protein
MKKRNVDKRPKMIWQIMDVRDLKYEKEFFDLIIDKSTLDCMSCCENAALNIAKMLN